VTGERPVALFVPPEVVAGPAVTPRPARSPTTPMRLVPGMAAVDHSGRVRDTVVFGVLGWEPGERTEVGVRAEVLLVRRVQRGGAVIDARGRVFLPGAACAQLGIAVGERLLVVAVPDRDLLIVHRLSVVAALFADRYTDEGMLDDQP
jgi:hypothetical protein